MTPRLTASSIKRGDFPRVGVKKDCIAWELYYSLLARFSFRVARHVRQDTIRYVHGPRTTVVNYRDSRGTRIYYISSQIGSVSYYASWPIAFINIRDSCAPIRRSFSSIGVRRRQDVSAIKMDSDHWNFRRIIAFNARVVNAGIRSTVSRWNARVFLLVWSVCGFVAERRILIISSDWKASVERAKWGGRVDDA